MRAKCSPILTSTTSSYTVSTGSGRKRRSGEIQLLTLVEELMSSLDRGKQHDLAVLGLSKAFGLVPHARLLSKLDLYDVTGGTHEWIKAFLTNRTQQVVVDSATSDQEPVISGIPQGNVYNTLSNLY